MNISNKRVKTLKFDRSVPKQIFEHLRDEIVSMELAPGMMISETSLAEKFGVSRTPVREALFKLNSMGFVEVRPQRGTFVSHLSMPKILEARFIREALELAVVAKIAETADNAFIAHCEAIIKEQEQAAAEHQPMLFQALDDKFHNALADQTQFPKLSQLIEAEKGHMDRVRNLSLKEIRGQYEVVLKQHKAILEAIKTRDPEQARKAMETHMHEVFTILELAPANHPEYFSEE